MVSYNDLKDLSMDEIILIAKDYLDAGSFPEVIEVMSLALDMEPDHPQCLFILGTVFMKSNREGIAETLFRRALERAPQRAEIWGSIGRCIDSYTRPEESIKFLKKAVDMAPNSPKTMVNLSNAYSLDGQWELSLEWAKKVLEIDPESDAGHDNLGMAYLALGEWGKGWDGHNYGLGHKFRPETQYGEEGRWDGTKGQSVIVCGEQGLGDEILYGSCLPDIIRDSKEVIVDCDHRLEGLFRRSFPEASVYGTRGMEASWPRHHTWDARCSIGCLPQFYRRKDEDFPGTPFLKADPVRRKQWRVTLDDISDRPKIGITWKGGGKLTARNNRSIPLKLLAPLAELGDLIDLSHEKRDHGDLEIHQWDHATLTNDYDDTAALVAELDLVVTVCTSIVHLAGGLGVPTYVLVPPKPSWRYNYGNMIWYDSVDLYQSSGDWSEVINRLVTDITERKVA